MRLQILVLLLAILALPSIAAETYQIPITIVPGSLVYQPRGNVGTITPESATFPVQELLLAELSGGACSAGSATFEANLVNGGLELTINGVAAGISCTLGGTVSFDVEIAVPELGGTSTTTRLVPAVETFDFVDFRRVASTFVMLEPTSSSIPGFGTDGVRDFHLNWDAPPEVEPSSTTVTPLHWIPGDTIGFHVDALIEIQSGDGRTAQGNAKTRWEYRVTVPEPSASLSLPIAAGMIVAVQSIGKARGPAEAY